MLADVFLKFVLHELEVAEHSVILPFDMRKLLRTCSLA
jgi:hypothetical protein